jgi:hypothetical protein
MLACLLVLRIKKHYWTFVYSSHASPRLHGGQCRYILLVLSYLENIFHYRNTMQILSIVPVTYRSSSQHDITVGHKMVFNRFSKRWVSFHSSVWWQYKKTFWFLKCAVYAFETWFQQDDAASHTARISMDMLWNIFPGWHVSRFRDITWPPWSLDLTAPDFFLWGMLKVCVYHTHPATNEELKTTIRKETAAISKEETQKIISRTFSGQQMFCLRRSHKRHCFQETGHLCLYWISEALRVFW